MRKTILLVIMTTAIIFSACTGRQAKEKEKLQELEELDSKGELVLY